MIARTFDAERINEMVNDLEIRPYVGGDIAEPLDLSAAVADPDNWFLSGEHGAFGCIWTAPQTYEVHTFVMPSGRGEWAGRFAQAGRQFMAEEANARHLWTCVPVGADNIRRFALAGGLTPCGFRVTDAGAGPVKYELLEWRRECP